MPRLCPDSAAAVCLCRMEARRIRQHISQAHVVIGGSPVCRAMVVILNRVPASAVVAQVQSGVLQVKCMSVREGCQERNSVCKALFESGRKAFVVAHIPVAYRFDR